MNKVRNSTAGYVGAFIIVISTFIAAFFLTGQIPKDDILIVILCATFMFMLVWELLSYSDHKYGHLFGDTIYTSTVSRLNRFKSSCFRYFALVTPWLIMNFILQNHYHFQTNFFNFPAIVFSQITWFIIYAGLPYIYLTLSIKGHKKYEFNDYALLLILLAKALLHMVLKKPFKHILYNRRIQKICLVWVVTFFFLPLMIQFYNIEFTALMANLRSIQASSFTLAPFYEQYSIFYQFIFHLIFVVDAGIAVIAYTVSSRWLHNRVKSVDRTMGGWFVALLCYPPMNSAFTSQFIGYNYFPTHPVINSELLQMIVWAIILILFTLYVWATVALGFKFSNLSNRGIISSGPYKYLRHPAYTTKNIAWWFENSYVLSSVPASLALLAGNIIYILRGLTEERHLRQDSDYLNYCARVKNRFFINFK